MEPIQKPLSNVQLELLKLFSTDMSDEDLDELKSVITQFYAKKAMDLADKIWDERGLTQDDMEKWIREKS